MCEIKYGEEKAIVYKNDPPGNSSNEDQFEVPIDDLNEYINFGTLPAGEKVPYKKVEIFLPSQLLKVKKQYSLMTLRVTSDFLVWSCSR